MPKKTIDAKSFAKDVKDGIKDAELKEKYNIPSDKVLENLFAKLLDASLITQNEIDKRNEVRYESRELTGSKDEKTKPVNRPDEATRQSKLNKAANKTIKAIKKAKGMNRYKIIGGSFGLTGELVVHKNEFSVFSTQKVSFDRNHVQDIVMKSGSKSKKYSIFSIIVGIIITFFLTMIFNVVGFIIGILFTIVGSRYSIKRPNEASILLKDGKTIDVSGKLDRLLSPN